MKSRSRSIHVSRQLVSLWGVRGRQLVHDVLATVPPSFERVPLHLLVLDPQRRRVSWVASRLGHGAYGDQDFVCPDALHEGDARSLPALEPLLAPLGHLDDLYCVPLSRGDRTVGLLVAESPPRRHLSLLRRHAQLAAAGLIVLQESMAEQRELEGYRALSHLLDVGAPHDRRSLARALGRSMARVTRARTCLVLARAHATQPLVPIGSRGYNSRKAHGLVMWPEEEPWASALMHDTVVEVDTEAADPGWRTLLGPGRVLLVPIRWQSWVRSALIFPADAEKTGGTHLIDPAQLASVGAHAGLMWQNAELIRALRRDEEVLQGLMQRSIQVQEEERRRIASDIHDGVTQRIVGIWYRLLALEKLLPEAVRADGPQHEARRAMKTIKEQVDLAMQEARAAIFNLRPSTLDDLGLIPSVRSLVSDFRAETQGNIEMEVLGERRLPDYVEVGIYRIVQEGLRNVAKHAQATHAQLTLRMTDDHVRLTLSDDGRGFQQRKKSGNRLASFGLESMAERAQMMGAELFVRTAPGEGTRIRVSIPIPRESGA